MGMWWGGASGSVWWVLLGWGCFWDVGDMLASVGVDLVVLLLSARRVCAQACLRKSEESLGIGSLNLSSNFYVTQPPFFLFSFSFLRQGLTIKPD